MELASRHLRPAQPPVHARGGVPRASMSHARRAFVRVRVAPLPRARTDIHTCVSVSQRNFEGRQRAWQSSLLRPANWLRLFLGRGAGEPTTILKTSPNATAFDV